MNNTVFRPLNTQFRVGCFSSVTFYQSDFGQGMLYLQLPHLQNGDPWRSLGELNEKKYVRIFKTIPAS